MLAFRKGEKKSGDWQAGANSSEALKADWRARHRGAIKGVAQERCGALRGNEDERGFGTVGKDDPQNGEKGRGSSLGKLGAYLASEAAVAM